MTNKKLCVYTHRIGGPSGKIVYVGIGHPKFRPYDFESRNYKWKQIFEDRGPWVDILGVFEPEYAAEMEKELIALHRPMANLTSGGEFGGEYDDFIEERWGPVLWFLVILVVLGLFFLGQL